MKTFDWRKSLIAILTAVCVIWAQEDDGDWEDEPEPAPVVELPKPKPKSIAQALAGSSLSKGCVADFTNLLENGSFDMTKFMKELPPAVAKVKLQMKSPFGKPKDGDKTNVGLTVGCIKALPESPAEMQSLLKDISLSIGLDFAADALASSSIPADVGKGEDSGGGLLKPIASIGLAVGGLGAIIYGVAQNGKVSDSVDKRDGKAAVDAEKSRNISYGVGAGLLACGLTIYFVF